jgi:hypothetical protein
LGFEDLRLSITGKRDIKQLGKLPDFEEKSTDLFPRLNENAQPAAIRIQFSAQNFTINYYETDKTPFVLSLNPEL